MDKRKDISSIIQESFSKGEDFDFSSWNEIEDKLSRNDDFSRVIQESYNKPNIDDAESISQSWEEVNDSLDINTVWERIAEKKKRRFAFLPFGIAASIVLVLGLILIPTSEEGTIVSVNTKENKTIKSRKEIVEPQEYEFFNKKNIVIKRQQNDTERKVVKIEMGDEVEIVLAQETLLSSLSKGVVKLDVPVKKQELCVEPEFLSKVNLPEIENFKRKRQNKIGVFSQIANSWLVNNEYYEAKKKGSLIENEDYTVLNYGLYAERYLYKDFFVSLNYYVQAKHGYSNNQFRKGGLINKKTEYSFNRLALGLGKDFNLHKGLYLTFNASCYYSQLKKKQIFQNGTLIYNGENTEAERGVQGELLIRRKFKRLSFDVGFVQSIGLEKVFKSSVNSSISKFAGGTMKLGYSF